VAATRRLVVIMFTDMVGYTAAAQADEKTALVLRGEQEELVRPLLAAYQGREVKSTGDGFLVEFESALRALECAVEIQRQIHARNEGEPVTPIQLRIGIHLGDVERQGADIFGDAVNIASRIEPLAEPGGICVSAAVHEQVRNKTPVKLERLPSAELKGLQAPISVFRVVLPWMAGQAPPSGTSTRLAVLPFTSISPDPSDEYFADGLTEELITILAQLPTLLVIARTSVVHYKSTSKTIAQIGAELSVSTVVEGSVRKAGDQLRITVQLIDVASEGHTWAHTYDRKLDDVFAVQTDVAERIAAELKIKTAGDGKHPTEDRPPVRPESYIAYLKGRALFHANPSAANYVGARKQFELALTLDPNNARALAGLADITRYIHFFGLDVPTPDWDERSRSYAARAIELEPGLAEAHCTRAAILWDNFEYVEAEKEFRRSLALNPSNSQAHNFYGALLMDEGRTEEALQEATMASQVDPNSMRSAWWHVLVLLILRRLDAARVELERLRTLDSEGAQYLGVLRYYQFVRGEYSDALRTSEQIEALFPAQSHTNHAWILAAMGEKDKARQWLLHQEARSVKHSESDLASAYAMIGDMDACFRHFDKAIATHDVSLQIPRNEPALAPMRRDPRFATVLTRMNLG
jgi:adenylate cyclase